MWLLSGEKLRITILYSDTAALYELARESKIDRVLATRVERRLSFYTAQLYCEDCRYLDLLSPERDW